MQKIIPITVGLVVIGVIVVGALLIGNRKSEFSGNQQRTFSQSIINASNATTPQVITLKNGDSYDLTASIVKKSINGEEVKMLAYNGSIPGPLIKVPQGAEIMVKFTNNTDVDSTIHSHGVRVDNKFDGVPDVTQDSVKPGQSFTYTLKFPDVGVYWYHPHIREDYAQELGLYGNFLVTPSTQNYWNEVDREETLILDDILIENGQIAPFDKSFVDHTLMGRFGNTMLVNGTDTFNLSVKQGERVRFYVTNVANSRVFNFAIPNTHMKLVGSDNGKYERETWADSVLLGPSERAIVETWFDKSGEYSILNVKPENTTLLGKITVEQGPVKSTDFKAPIVNQDVIDSLSSLRQFFSQPVDKKLALMVEMMGNDMQHTMGNEGEGMMMDHNQMGMADIQKIEWDDDMGMINTQATTDTLKWKLIDQKTNKINMDINWQFKKGEIVKIEIYNDENSMHPMQHPIHIHGQRFLVLSTNGVISTNLVWKDTVLIQTGDRVELLVQMDNPGDWMIHCHIPEHMESGMMSQFKVL